MYSPSVAPRYRSADGDRMEGYREAARNAMAEA